MSTARPRPEITPRTAPYWAALAEDVLRFQRCRGCGIAWLPPRDQCPHCLGPDHEWEDASGRARLVSWVVYHTEYHPFFAEKLPYTVAVVELQEGPRLIAGLVDGAAPLVADMPLVLQVCHQGDLHFPAFSPTA